MPNILFTTHASLTDGVSGGSRFERQGRAESGFAGSASVAAAGADI